MNFKKDLLLIDTELTGLDPEKHEIIQLAAVLLDKKTLREKKTFNSFIRPLKWKNRDRESMKINRITHEQVKIAPPLKAVINEFHKRFSPEKVILSYYGGPADMDFLRAAYKKVKKKFAFDYHYFNLWGLFYTYLSLKGRLSNKKKFAGFSLDDFSRNLKLSEDKNRHDALVDCRVEAEIFRRVVNRFK